MEHQIKCFCLRSDLSHCSFPNQACLPTCWTSASLTEIHSAMSLAVVVFLPPLLSIAAAVWVSHFHSGCCTRLRRLPSRGCRQMGWKCCQPRCLPQKFLAAPLQLAGKHCQAQSPRRSVASHGSWAGLGGTSEIDVRILTRLAYLSTLPLDLQFELRLAVRHRDCFLNSYCFISFL